MSTDESLRYPIGKYQPPEKISPEQRAEWISTIEMLPDKLKRAVSYLTEAQLDTPYRPGGWTVRQVVHHVPDSHMNAYIRVKLALTEDEPPIKPYDEAAWAKLNDVRDTPIETSLVLLETHAGSADPAADDETVAAVSRHKPHVLLIVLSIQPCVLVNRL